MITSVFHISPNVLNIFQWVIETHIERWSGLMKQKGFIYQDHSFRENVLEINFK